MAVRARLAPFRSASLVALLLLALPGTARGVTWYVDCVNGNDLNSGTSAASAKKSLKPTVEGATAGDTVRVAAGVCDLVNQFDLTTAVPPGVSVIGAGPTATSLRNTGSFAGVNVFSFNDQDQSFPRSQVISDLEIVSEVNGIEIWNGSPTIRNNVIRGTSTNRGAGVAITTLYAAGNPNNDANPLVEGNTFADLEAGVSVVSLDAGAAPVTRRNWILGLPGVAFQGIYAAALGDPVDLRLENNVIAGWPVGLYAQLASATIVNNTVVASGSGLELEGCVVGEFHNNILAGNDRGVLERSTVDTTVASMRNNDFHGNAVSDYVDVLLGPVADPNTLPNSSGNLDLLPGFVDPAADDYHLQPGSALRDAGTTAGAPADDVDGQARSDGLPDVGADETSNIGLPNLRVTAHQLVADLCPGQEPPGNNANIDPGETIDLYIEVTNFSALARATNVTATISPATGGFVPPSDTLAYGTINPLRTLRSQGLYHFRWYSSFDCRSKIRFDVRIFSTETGLLPAQTYEVTRTATCDTCSNPQKPDVVLDRVDLVDSCPNGEPPGGNGALDPGEAGQLRFTVTNRSAAARATTVVARVTTSTPGITPTSGVVVLGNVAPGATLTSPSVFDFTADPALVSCGGTVVFDVDLDWLENPPAAPNRSVRAFNVPSPCVNCAAVSPDLRIVSPPPFSDSCSTRPSDGRLDPGERFDVTLSVRNASASAGATNVTGRIYALSPLVVPQVSPTFTIGPVLPGATRPAAPVQFRLDRAAACGASLPFEVELVSDQNGTLARQPFALAVASPCVTCSDIPPTIDVVAHSFTDLCIGSSPPGANGGINPGETVQLRIDVRNSSNVAQASTVTAEITLREPWVSPASGSIFVDDIPPLQTRTSLTSFPFAVSRTSSVCAGTITVDVVLDSVETGRRPPQTFTLAVEGPPASCAICPVPVPELSAADRPPADRCPFGPPGGDGRVDPGEFVDLVLDVTNSSTFAPATGVTALFTTTFPGVTPSSGAVAGPDVPPGGSVALDPFTFSIDASRVGCGAVIPWSVTLSSAETGPLAPPESVTVTVAASCSTCRQSFLDVLLYRASIPSLAPGWKQAAGLPLASTSPGRDGAPWPLLVDSPGTTTDPAVAVPLVLYRLVDDQDGDLGNLLRLAKVRATGEVFVSY